MFIENITIHNFRNFKKEEISFNKNINFIIGDNAQGKTNLVESIYFPAFLKSFRSHKNLYLINKNNNFFNLKLTVNDNKVKNKINVYFSNNKKEIEVNGKKPENYNYLNVVVFYPDEVNFLTSFPSFRRNLIDKSIFYINNNYINIYRKYLRCLKQRNNFLKKKNKEDDIWKNQLIIYGSEIIKERIRYISKINKILDSEFFKTNNYEQYFLKYSNNYLENNIEKQLIDEFSRKETRERQLGYTLAGPHKDDIIFYLDDQPVESFASQGQKRSLVISYKTAQILDYKRIQGHYPVLILDDMTSELDSHRKNVLLENLLENSGQVFITSTDLNQMYNFANSKVYKVENGSISCVD